MQSVFLNTDAASMLVHLFLQANIIVQLVVVGLLAASVWTWAIIISFTLKLRRANRESDQFERDFWKAQDIDKFYEGNGRVEIPAAKVFGAGVVEWRRSTGRGPIDREGTRSRLASSMASASAAEVDQLSNVPAPGIAEALAATAIGLFAAIPAVIAYNRFSHGINRLEAKLNRFADSFHATLSRELELDR